MGDWDDELALFAQFVQQAQSVPYYGKWASANGRSDTLKWAAFRDALLRGETPTPPSMATAYGKSLVTAGKEHMAVSHLVNTVVQRPPIIPPEAPPPSPPPGNLLDAFTDFHSPTAGGTTIFVNRWENDGNSAMQTLSQSGPPWPAPVNGPGVNAISTPYGAGFQMICDAQMNVGSGGKKAQIVDNQLSIAGVDQAWRGKCYFPSSGNPSGFPPGFNSWNLLWELHDDVFGVGFQFGVNTDSGFGPVPSIYFRSSSSSWNTHTGTGVALQYNTWYDWRVEYKLSLANDGYIRFYWQPVGQADILVFQRLNAPNMVSGQRIPPYLQFGFYGPETLLNEVWYAGLSVV